MKISKAEFAKGVIGDNYGFEDNFLSAQPT